MPSYLESRESIDGAGCVLCNPRPELPDGSATSFDVIHGTRCLGEDLLCAPDIAPISEGHTLIFPSTHWTSFADYCAASQSWPAVLREIDHVARALQPRGGDVLAFEHGSPAPWGPAVSGKCGSTEHAHVHLVPHNDRIDEALVRELARALACDVSPDVGIGDVGPRPNGYLWVRGFAARTNAILLPGIHQIPSQLVRRTLASLLYDEPQSAVRATWRDFLYFDANTAERESRACHKILSLVGPSIEREK